MNNTESTVKKAVEGDKQALEQIVNHVQDMVYNLAIRMLWHPEKAKDAAQEILIKVITNLSSYKHQSSLKTWVYRLAVNSLINYKKAEKKHILFDDFADGLSQGFSDTINYTSNKAEQNLLVAEAKIGCSNAMLQCLTETERLIYIFGEILEFNSTDAAIVLELSPENFRKRLSRIRKKMNEFLNGNCGIVNPDKPCRCYKKVDYAISKKRIHPNNLLFVSNSQTQELIQTIDRVENEVGLFLSNPEYESPIEILNEIRQVISASNDK